MAEKFFKSMTAFATHLGTVALAVHEADRHAMDKATKVVQTAAKAKFGEYQPEAGPFVAWAPLADETVADKHRQGFGYQKSEDDPLLRSGHLRDSIDRRFDATEGQVGSEEDVMVYQELGTATIPPRSVLGSAAVEQGEKVAEILGDGAVTALVGEGVFGGKLNLKG